MEAAMDTRCEGTKDDIRTRLAYRNGFLCVVAERCQDGPEPKTLKLWYPVREAEEAEVQTLLGRPVAEIDQKEGIYVDEEGTVFQLANKGETKPILVEETAGERGELEQLLTASLGNGKSPKQARTHALLRSTKRRKKSGKGANGSARPDHDQVPSESRSAPQSSDAPEWDRAATAEPAHLNLRQKLAEVRRRIGYVQKRGFNERNNYSYVTAADLAGAVGDILAELGVVIVPRLESIAYEPARSNGAEAARAAQVVMAYTFTDVETGDEITTKVAGQGLDAGDKAPYKAMTGALKYALLQSFLLATGDDPEDERISHTPGSERLITPEEGRQLRALVDETGTELERVLSYYKINALEEMSESSYRRAVELLNRKRTQQHTQQGSNHHAQD
jgi:hypothetical protein